MADLCITDTDTTTEATAALRRHLEVAWCRETSAEADTWTLARPSTGQCAVTALVVHERLGGEILRVEIPGSSHYYNLVGGREVDLTRDQFDAYCPTSAPETRSREYLLSNASTTARYRMLAERLADAEYGG